MYLKVVIVRAARQTVRPWRRGIRAARALAVGLLSGQ